MIVLGHGTTGIDDDVVRDDDRAHYLTCSVVASNDGGFAASDSALAIAIH